MIFKTTEQITSNLSGKYDWFQEEELRLAKEAGIDTSSFDNPKISYLHMREIRIGFEEGMDLTKYLKMDAKSLREIRKAARNGIDLGKYVEEGYARSQLEEIAHALRKGIKIDSYITPEYRGKSIREIATGLEHGIDVSAYSKVEYSFAQMQEIRLGIEHHADFGQYLNPLYDAGQMREIRLGLEECIDVSEYTSFINTDKEMNRRRMELCAQNDYEIYKALKDSKQSAKGENPENMIVTVSDDGMTATVTLMSQIGVQNRKRIIEWLKRNRVTNGINEEILEKLVGGSLSPGDYIIAEGKKSERGKDGYYEYYF